MYKNFSLTEKEKKQILEQHRRYGYKKPLKESFNDEDDYNEKVVQFIHIILDGSGEILDVEMSNTSIAGIVEKHKEHGHKTKVDKKNGLIFVNYEGGSKYGFFDDDNEIYLNLNKHSKLGGAIKSRFERGDIKSANELLYKIPRLNESFNGEGDSMMSQKQYNEEGFSDEGKFRISNAGVPVNKIMVSVELTEDYENDDVNFTLKSDGNGNLTIVDFDNPSNGEIDDEEVREYMESMIASGKLIVPDFISFDPETGKVGRFNY